MILRIVSTLVLLGAAPAVAGEPDFARLFAGRDGCFELYDMSAKKVTVRSDSRRCARRTSPCSTFKVPLALMAFDAGLLADERAALKWDGTHYSREAWNHDQTALSWMQNSVVWFSQRLTPMLGMARVKDYLARFDFGNQDMSGGLTTAWLDSSLAISPDEQLRFWDRWWRGELAVSQRAVELTKRITLVDTSASGWTLHGKTGSGKALGWFVGHVERGGKQYVFVTRYVDREQPADPGPPGPIARELTKTILAALGLY